MSKQSPRKIVLKDTNEKRFLKIDLLSPIEGRNKRVKSVVDMSRTLSRKGLSGPLLTTKVYETATSSVQRPAKRSVAYDKQSRRWSDCDGDGLGSYRPKREMMWQLY